MYFSLKNRLDQPLLSTDFNQPDLNKTNMDKESNDGITSSHLYYVFFFFGGGHGLYIVRLTSWGWHSDNLSGFLWHSGSGCMVLHTTQMKQMLKSAMAQDSVKHQNNKQKRAGRKDITNIWRRLWTEGVQPSFTLKVCGRGRSPGKKGRKGTLEAIWGKLRQPETLSILVVISTLEDSTAITRILFLPCSIFGSRSR